MPAGMAFGMLFMPLGLHFSFLASLVIGLAQSTLLRQTWFRNWANLPPIVLPGQANQQAPVIPAYSRINVRSTYKPPTAQEVVKEAGPIGRIKDGVNDQWKGFKKAAFEKMGREDPDAGPEWKKSPRSKEFMKNADKYERRRRKEIKEEKEGYM
jgi:hypothetical protein